MERRLAAILAADVVGYTRLMGADEAGTLRRLTDLREKILEPLIAEHHGRVVKLMGDGLLVEFGSAVDSVACAIAWQDRMALHEIDRDTGTMLQFRIGINLGDIIVEGDDIHGDGVNIAARLEGLAQPGSICLSDDIYRHAKGKIETQFEDMGEHKLKNVADPIRVYVVAVEQSGATAPVPATEPLPLPDKPSIAVLPFQNMSGDPEQEYFADGITEDIITELSRFRSLFIIGRNSSFHYKGQSPRIPEVGRELGVQYIVEGSVRKVGNRVRITVQLLEANKDKHLWAERYDRELDDIFAVQDEVVEAIASALPGRIEAAATELARQKPTTSLTAYDYLLRGEWAWWRDEDSEALEFFQKAVEVDPNYARALARLALLHGYRIFTQGSAVDEQSRRARNYIEQAITIDDEDPSVLAIASTVYSQIGAYDQARINLQRAVALNPGDAEVNYRCGMATTYQGEPMEGLKWFEKAMRLNPYYSDSWLESMFEAYFVAQQYEKALETLKKYRNPPFHLFIQIAASHAQLGHDKEAKEAVDQFVQYRPEHFDVHTFVMASINCFSLPKHRELWLEGYRKVGLLD